MDKQEQIMRLNTIIANSRCFTNLQANDDFIRWRDDFVKPRLDSIKDSILSVDRTSPNWKEIVCDLVAVFQEFNLTYSQLFEIASKTSEMANKELQNLSKPEDSS